MRCKMNDVHLALRFDIRLKEDTSTPAATFLASCWRSCAPQVCQCEDKQRCVPQECETWPLGLESESPHSSLLLSVLRAGLQAPTHTASRALWRQLNENHTRGSEVLLVRKFSCCLSFLIYVSFYIKTEKILKRQRGQSYRSSGQPLWMTWTISWKLLLGCVEATPSYYLKIVLAQYPWHWQPCQWGLNLISSVSHVEMSWFQMLISCRCISN